MLARLRAFCLSLPGTSEVPSWGHPNFKVGGRIFAVYEVYRGRPAIAFLAEEGTQDLLIDDVRFYRTPYIGHRGWVSAWVDDKPDWPLLRSLVKRSYDLIAAGRISPAKQGKRRQAAASSRPAKRKRAASTRGPAKRRRPGRRV